MPAEALGRRTGPIQRVRTAVVDQHATWIAVNPIQGCPKRCGYCFLNERGQAAVKPETLASPEEAVQLLLDSPFYAPARPVALYTWTDVMALPASRDHLAGMLREMVRRGLTNPTVLITKCHVPDDTIGLAVDARRSGLPLLVYLSYSGFDREMERGIRHDALLGNFPRLADADIPLVHYWRPALPETATAATMERVLDWAARYARCSVAAGLKVEPAALPRLSQLWPELGTVAGATEAEGVYPRPFWEFIHRTWQRHPNYPLFHTNACALAYALGQADSFGVFGSTVCRMRNHCPVSQRERCHQADNARRIPTRLVVEEALVRRGLGGLPFELLDDGRELVISGAASASRAAALTQDLGVRVQVRRDSRDPYWSSGTAGAVPLIIP